MNQEELNIILDKHKKWLRDEDGGERADLSSANLSFADLSSANLSFANLSSANLSFANLSYADLSSANLSFADLSSANLSFANLSYADLSSANLSFADLSFANLSSAPLNNVIGNAQNIMTLIIETYQVTYTDEYLHIGCERHKIEEWREFDDKQILEMDGKQALSFWRKYKDFIFTAIELSPAKPTGFKEELNTPA